MNAEIFWAAALGFCLTSALILLLIAPARRFGLVDHPDERKQHAKPTPIVGGIAMFIGLAVSVAFVSPSPDTLAPFLAGSGLLIALGLIDDVRDVDFRIRFVTQITAASILVSWGDMRIDSLGNLLGLGAIDLGPFATPFTIFAVVGLINAVNMLDGLDGLAGGVTLSILVPVVAYSHLQGISEIAVIGGILSPVIIAYLLFNYRFPWRKRALVFMGDAGSNFLGFALAWVTITLAQAENSGLSPIAILWLVAFPVADTITTIWRRRRKGQSAFQPDHDHVHFVLQRAGFGLNTTVLIISGLSALCTVIAIAASWDGFPEPLLFFGLIGVFALHNLFLSHTWRITKKFRRLLALVSSTKD